MPRASSLEAEILREFDGADVTLIESSGGAFEVTVDGDLIFSKLEGGRHAEDGEVLGLIRTRNR